MTDEELLVQCKIGLNIPAASTALDGTITQKLLAVKAFMIGAGVKAETIADDDLAVGTIVIGVTDLWELKSGEIKFSPVFFTLVSQLALR